ncbi:MAG: glycosyltransferase family 1 protein, partial [Nocardioidaceae bacterium]|nr:glycosyltransferase family 1 protein [Nocardioidaceae bacterium]
YEGVRGVVYRDGIRFVHRGSKLMIYVRALIGLTLRQFGPVDVVVDVQNGLPFFTRLATRKPVIVLVHHVHREQWPVVYSGLMGKVGWLIESKVAPFLYRKSRYVAVSQATKRELADLGVDNQRVTVIHNGNDPAPATTSTRATEPTIVVVGRLVPHKQVEHAIDAVRDLTGLGVSLDVVGDGWWADELHAYAEAQGVSDRVRFHGFVDDLEKHEVLAQAWVMALPSLKEGWGLVVGEAGLHDVPTVAYRSAGGTTESIDDHISGLLVDTPAEFTAALRLILTDERLRDDLGTHAQKKSQAFTWDCSEELFARAIASPEL